MLVIVDRMPLADRLDAAVGNQVEAATRRTIGGGCAVSIHQR